MFRCPTWNRSYAPGAYPIRIAMTSPYVDRSFTFAEPAIGPIIPTLSWTDSILDCH
jgi:hypothetical protein